MNTLERMTLMLRLATRARRAKVPAGTSRIIGLIGRAETAIAPEGTIFLRNELWHARSRVDIAPGETVRVTGVNGLTLDVDPDQYNADPASIREEPARTKNAGCYIEVWSDKNFEGEYLRIEGPGEYHALEFAGLEWGDSISSLRVGPSSFVLVYADREFKGTMMSFGPGQEVSNLEELDFNDDIDSIRLVNSIKIFDEFRSEDVCEPAGVPEKKRNKRKIRGG